MRIVRFEHEGRSGYGILEGEKIQLFWGTPYDGGITATGEVLALAGGHPPGPLRAQQDRGPGA